MAKKETIKTIVKKGADLGLFQKIYKQLLKIKSPKEAKKAAEAAIKKSQESAKKTLEKGKETAKKIKKKIFKAKGGSVRRMNAGGSVSRGTGAAIRGTKFKGVF